MAAPPNDLLDLLPQAVFVVRDLTFEWVNRAGAALLHTTSEALAGTEIGPYLADGEAARLASALRLIRSGAALADPGHVRIIEPGSHRELELHVDVVRLDPAGTRAMLVGALPMPPTHGAAVYAKLAKLAPVSDSAVSLAALFARVDAVFVDLGWRAFLLEPEGDGLRARHTANTGGDEPLDRYARGLVNTSLTTAQMWITAEVLRSGEPVYVDDFVGRLSAAPGVAGQAAKHVAERPGIMRGAWVPVPGPRGPAAVLLVIGATISENDSIALRLFAGQIAATIRIEAMRAELVQRERLAAVGEMSAVLAHEVRNPLAIVANAGATLRRILGGEATDDARQLLDILDEETERLNRLVRDLLAFARPSDPQLAIVPLASLLAGALRAVAQDPTGDPTLAETALVSLAVDATHVSADPELLHRALVNVLLNATQHRSPRGDVRIDAVRSAPGEICVRVYNDGAHLPAEVRERVFDPFFTTRPHGTGLGLAVVRRTVEAIGGHVDVSAESAGVAVAMYLPAAQAEPLSPVA